jgi:outer membrane biosynthesis protein TonB
VGDAGWAGSLVETWERDSERPLYLVFQPGQPVLTLLAEALALLGPEKRWNVTFSTYFTGGQPGVSCGWRCVPAGSPEALEAEGAGHWILDLTRDLGRAPGSPWVDRARAGRVAHRNETGTARPVSVPGGEALKTASAWEDSSALLPDWSELTASEGGIAAAAAQTQAPPVPTRKLAGAALPVGAPLLPHLPDRASERRRTPWPLVAVGVVMLAVGIGLGLGLARLNLNERPIDDARPEPVANPSTEKPFAKDGPEKKDANKAVPPVRPPEKERQPEPRPPDKPAAQPRKPGELKDEIKAPSPAPVKQLDLLAYKELETLDGWKDLLKDLHEAKPGQEAAALQKSLPRLNAAVGALNKARSRHEEWKKGLGAALDARPFTPLREMLEKDQDVESGMISRAFKDGLDTMKRDWYQAEAQKDRRALAAERLDRLTALIDKFKKEKAKPSKPDTEFNQQLIRLGAILALLADFEDKGYLKGIAPLNDADPTKIRDSVYGKDGILKNLNSEFFPDEFPKDGPRKEARPDPSR